MSRARMKSQQAAETKAAVEAEQSRARQRFEEDSATAATICSALATAGSIISRHRFVPCSCSDAVVGSGVGSGDGTVVVGSGVGANEGRRSVGRRLRGERRLRRRRARRRLALAGLGA